MKVEIRPIGTVKPYWRNPRKNDRAVKAVKSSIKRYGFLQPLVVDPDGVIIAGHTRYRALMEIGTKEVPVIVAELTDAKAKEYRIADNATSDLSEWDMQPLITELRELPELNVMTDFLPTLDVEALVADVKAPMSTLPTQELIEDTEQRRLAEFNEKNKRDLQSYVEIVCPECGADFAVTRHDVMVNTSE